MIKETSKEFNKDYQKLVARFIARDSDWVLGNHTTMHAADIMQQFIRSAKEEVVILGGASMWKFFNEYAILETIQVMLERSNAIFRIVTIDQKPKHTSKMQSWVEDTCKSLKAETRLHYRPAIFNGHHSEQEHFMVVDKKRYRLEEGHGRHTKLQEECMATINACDTSGKARDLVRYDFNVIWDKLGKDM